MRNARGTPAAKEFGDKVKIRTSIAAAFTALLATLFVALPAHAHEGHEHHEASMFDTAGLPLNLVGIIITVVILAVIVLLLAGWVSSLFKKN